MLPVSMHIYLQVVLRQNRLFSYLFLFSDFFYKISNVSCCHYFYYYLGMTAAHYLFIYLCVHGCRFLTSEAEIIFLR